MFVVLALVCVALVFYYLSQGKFYYWKKRKVPCLKPIPLVGNYKDYFLLRKTFYETVDDMCKKFPDEPYFGSYYGADPTLVVTDPDYIRLMLVKDFLYFNSREIAKYTDREVVTRGLFFSFGDNWKIARQNFSPLFSSFKMKKMFYLIEECTGVLDKVLEKEFHLPSTKVKEMMAGYTIDCIGSCVFGVKSAAMEHEAEKNIFRHIGQSIFQNSYIMTYKLIMRSIWPAVFYGLGFNLFPNEITTFFNSLLNKVFEERQHEKLPRHDFIDLMLSLKHNKYIHGDSISNTYGETKKIIQVVDDEYLHSQCTTFFAAGFETSSSTLSHTLYELAKNPEAQEKAIAEVDEYFKNNDKLNYECVQETPYLTACINETMRLYTVIGVLTREVVEDYTLPSGVVLDKGVRIHIPIFSLHRNPDYFPEPECYRPERFLGDEKENIKSFTYMPFGEGPRFCIGMRFGMMQVIAGLMTILRKCRVELAEGMPQKLEFEPRSIVVTQTKNGVYLKFTPRLKVL